MREVWSQKLAKKILENLGHCSMEVKYMEFLLFLRVWVTKYLYQTCLMSMLKGQITGLHLRLSKSNSLEDKTQGSAFSQGSSVRLCVWVLKLENHCNAKLDFFNWQYFLFWFYRVACRVLVPLTRDQTQAPCSGSTES